MGEDAGWAGHGGAPLVIARRRGEHEGFIYDFWPLAIVLVLVLNLRCRGPESIPLANN